MCNTYTETHTHTQSKYKMGVGRDVGNEACSMLYRQKKTREKNTNAMRCMQIKTKYWKKKSRFGGLSFFEVLPSSTSAAADNRPFPTVVVTHLSPFPGVPESFVVPPVQPRIREGPTAHPDPAKHGLTLRQHLKDAHARHLLLHPPEDEPAGRRGGLLEHLLHRGLGGRPGRRRAHGREGREPR